MKEYREILQYMESVLTRNKIQFFHFEAPYSDCNMIDMGLRAKMFGIKNLPEHVIPLMESMERGKIYFIMDLFRCRYVAMKMPDEEMILVCGPVICDRISEENFDELFARVHMDEEYKNTLHYYYSKVTFLPSYDLLEGMFIELGKEIYGDNLEVTYEDMSEMEIYRRIYQNIFRMPEKPFSNVEMLEKRYEMENALIHEIEQGNEENAIYWFDELRKMSAVEFRKMKNQDRNYRDYVLTLNTLGRKAAEAGGVHPIFINGISNSMVIAIEDSPTLEGCGEVALRMIRAYACLVHEANHKGHSPIVQKILACISADLQEDLSLKAFASRLNVNASYLSTLFSKEVGVSLSEYVNQKRVEHGKKILRGSDYPIKQIAEYCGFQDTHYFCRVFKKVTGMSPKAYRDNLNNN